MILSILVLTIDTRVDLFNKLYAELCKQVSTMNMQEDIELLVNYDNENSIGTKRNDLLNAATGEYICYIDDDDEISATYIQDIISALDSKPDCVSLLGVITWDGRNAEMFEHSIRYSAYATTTKIIKYERFPNHLNTIKSSIAKQFSFQEIDFGEDKDWATKIYNSGLLKKEVRINKVLYFYKYKHK